MSFGKSKKRNNIFFVFPFVEKLKMIKKIFCCGCYFDKIYLLLNGNHLINWETFDEDGYDWIFKNLISSDLIVMCDDIFSEEVPAFDKLYKFELSK